MRAFISLTHDGTEQLARAAVVCVGAVLASHGYQPHSMLELTDADHNRLGLTSLPDFMNYAYERIRQADLLVAVVAGSRLGHGLLLELGCAAGAGVPVLVAQHDRAPGYLDELHGQRTLRFADVEQLHTRLSATLTAPACG